MPMLDELLGLTLHMEVTGHKVISNAIALPTLGFFVRISNNAYWTRI